MAMITLPIALVVALTGAATVGAITFAAAYAYADYLQQLLDHYERKNEDEHQRPQQPPILGKPHHKHARRNKNE